MEKFSEFIIEANEKSYRFLNLIHDTPDDPNTTGDKMVKEAKLLGINAYQLNVQNGYFTYNEKGNLVAHNYSIEETSPNISSFRADPKIEHDKEGWEVRPENTIAIIRVALGRGGRLAEQLRLQGIPTINSRY